MPHHLHCFRGRRVAHGGRLLIPSKYSQNRDHARGKSNGRVGRRELLAITLVLLAALAIRIVYLLQYRAHVPYYSALILDSHYYDSWAQRVVEGKGYGPMPFYMAPLYPYFLALIYVIVGHKPAVVYVVQAALGLVSLLLVYALARRSFGHRSGVLALVLPTLYAPLVYLESKVLTETLSISLNLSAVLLLMHAMGRSNGRRYLAAGVIFGLGVLCRPATLISLVLILVWLWATSRRREAFCRRALVPLIVGALLPVILTASRNYVVGKEFVPISTNGGIVFAQCNNPTTNGLCNTIADFTGAIASQQQEEMAIASRALGRPVKASESSVYWLKTGLGFIREQPVGYARLILKRLVWALHNGEAPCDYNVHFEKTLVPALRWLVLPFSIIAGLALFGLLAARKDGLSREQGLIAIYCLSIVLSLVVFSATSRYRAPIVPPLAVFSGFGLAQVLQHWRSARSVAMLAACIASVSLVSLVSYPVPRITPEAPANLGVSYMALGKTALAERYLRKSLEVKPDFAYAHLNLGVVLEKEGRDAEALPHFLKAVTYQPGSAQGHYRLGNALIRQKRSGDAAIHYAEAVRINPDYAEAHFSLGTVLRNEEKPAAAIHEFRQAIRVRPDYAEAHHNLGGLYDDLGRRADAIREYRKAIRARPDLAEAHNNLAVALYLEGDYAGAWKEVRLAERYGLKPNPEFLAQLARKAP